MKQSYLKYDFSPIEGSNCYCSDEAAEAIRNMLSKTEPDTPVWMGSGDYHYVSLFRAEQIRKAFTLVLFDNHPDDQNGAFDSDMLSCGNWVLRVRGLPLCESDYRNPVQGEISGKDIMLSVDLDVLSEKYAHTNWDQGDMSIEELCLRIRHIADSNEIVCIDICGELTEEKGGSEEDRHLNAIAVEAILKAARQ